MGRASPRRLGCGGLLAVWLGLLLAVPAGAQVLPPTSAPPTTPATEPPPTEPPTTESPPATEPPAPTTAATTTPPQSTSTPPTTARRRSTTSSTASTVIVTTTAVSVPTPSTRLAAPASDDSGAQAIDTQNDDLGWAAWLSAVGFGGALLIVVGRVVVNRLVSRSR